MHARISHCQHAHICLARLTQTLHGATAHKTPSTATTIRQQELSKTSHSLVPYSIMSTDIDGPWDPLRHAWYSSRQREPLNWILPGQSLDRAIKTINQILDSPRAHWIMARIIDGAGEDDAYRWAMELSQPPKPQPGALLVYAQEFKDFKAEEILVDHVVSVTFYRYQSF